MNAAYRPRFGTCLRGRHVPSGACFGSKKVTGAVVTDNLLLKSRIAKALSSECRILLLSWLREPDQHSVAWSMLKGRPAAVAVHNIEQKWNVSNSTARSHIWRLKSAGLIDVKRIDGVHWVTRNAKGIATARRVGHLFLTA